MQEENYTQEQESHQENIDAEKEARQQGFPKETMLEFKELEDGRLILSDMDTNEEPLVSIEFSDKVKDMLGGDVAGVGQHMIHAAIQVVMSQQMNHWHANVYDEEPEHLS